jgi:hypothetical protein
VAGESDAGPSIVPGASVVGASVALGASMGWGSSIGEEEVTQTSCVMQVPPAAQCPVRQVPRTFGSIVVVIPPQLIVSMHNGCGRQT